MSLMSRALSNLRQTLLWQTCSTSGYVHAVVATGLKPSTTYYYVVGSAPSLLCATSKPIREFPCSAPFAVALLLLVCPVDELAATCAAGLLVQTLACGTCCRLVLLLGAGPRSSTSRRSLPSAPGQLT